jgi:small subunit ribosomal protein S17e
LNKVRKLAEELLAKYPTFFSANFEANKKALEQVAIIRNRALRNQLAGAITSLASEIEPVKSESTVELEDMLTSSSSSSENSMSSSTGTEVSPQAQ